MPYMFFFFIVKMMSGIDKRIKAFNEIIGTDTKGLLGSFLQHGLLKE